MQSSNSHQFLVFLSTPSARRATLNHSFHTLQYARFLSTPSARRATHDLADHLDITRDFYPRPPRGGRPFAVLMVCIALFNFYPRPPRGGRQPLQKPPRPLPVFLSTPSARRAT